MPDNPDGTAVVVDCAYAQTGRTWFLPAVPSGNCPAAIAAIAERAADLITGSN